MEQSVVCALGSATLEIINYHCSAFKRCCFEHTCAILETEILIMLLNEFTFVSFGCCCGCCC